MNKMEFFNMSDYELNEDRIVKDQSFSEKVDKFIQSQELALLSDDSVHSFWSSSLDSEESDYPYREASLSVQEIVSKFTGMRELINRDLSLEGPQL